MSQKEDMEAINRYFSAANIRTEDAEEVFDEWRQWYDSLSWWEISFDGPTYDKARNLRNEFNLANATNRAEKEQAQRVMKTGLTAEELAGGTRRTLSSGMYGLPTFSTATKATLATMAIAAGLGYAAIKVLGKTLLRV